MKPNLLGGQNSKRLLKSSRFICLQHLCSRRLGEGFLSGFMWLLKIMSLGCFDSRTEDKEYVITYISRRLIDAETRYTFTEKLCLSLYYACTKLRHYLLSSTCIVVCQTDVLKRMLQKPVLNDKIGE